MNIGPILNVLMNKLPKEAVIVEHNVVAGTVTYHIDNGPLVTVCDDCGGVCSKCTPPHLRRNGVVEL